MSDTMSWREARDALTAAGTRSANEAQQILEDLAHFPERRFSYRGGGKLDPPRWLRYAGNENGQPRYLSSTERVP